MASIDTYLSYSLDINELLDKHYEVICIETSISHNANTLQVRFCCLILSEPLWPYPLLPWRKYTVRIYCILNCLDKPAICVIIEIVQRSNAI